MDREDLIYRVAVTLIPQVGDVFAKQLIGYCGGVKEVFTSSKAKLMKIPGIGEVRAGQILGQEILKRAEEEIEFIEKKGITPLFYLDKQYPQRLLQCHDAPVMLYYQGTADLNHQRIISIVGTRNATDYGKRFTEELVEGLKPYKVLVVSGLAYGIDVCAHKACLKNGIDTIGVFGHGLDKVYPAQHRSIAEKMKGQGGLLTDFMSNSRFDKENFPKRNRIIAGMADATIVVESKKKGGSIITAEIANSYNRDVFAVPGNVGSEHSEGCNFLIRSYKANLLDSITALVQYMGWEEKSGKKGSQQQLFIDLEPDEELIVGAIRESDHLRIDELSSKVNLTSSRIASTLLNLEFKGVVRSMPGKIYELT